MLVFFVLLSARIVGLQEDNKNLKLSLSKAEAERKHAQERSNNLEKVHTWSVSTKTFLHVEIMEVFIYVSLVQLFVFWVLLLPIGKEQCGDRPELQAEDVAAASGAGTDWTQSDEGTAHRQIWVYWRSQISCDEWYASPMSEHAFSAFLFFLFVYLSCLFCNLNRLNSYDLFSHGLMWQTVFYLIPHPIRF